MTSAAHTGERPTPATSSPCLSEHPPRSKAHTRSLLVAASIGVFEDRGLTGATVDDLTSAAGFTRGAFYSNFSSKEDVFWLAFAAATDDVVEAMHAVAKPAHDAPRSLEQVDPDLSGTLDVLHPLGLTWYVLLTEALVAARKNPDELHRVQAERNKVISAIAVALSALAGAPHVRLALDPEPLADALLGIYMNRIISEFADERTSSAQRAEFLGRILNTFVRFDSAEGA